MISTLAYPYGEQKQYGIIVPEAIGSVVWEWRMNERKVEGGAYVGNVFGEFDTKNERVYLNWNIYTESNSHTPYVRTPNIYVKVYGYLHFQVVYGTMSSRWFYLFCHTIWGLYVYI